MAKIDKVYQDLLIKIIYDGSDYDDPNRKGVKRRQIPYYNFEYSMVEGNFPALTTKKLFFKGVVGELIWFLRGSTNIQYLLDNNIDIWIKDAWTYLKRTSPYNGSLEEYTKEVKVGKWAGNVGRIYGAQWRNWGDEPEYDPKYETWDTYGGLDQIAKLFSDLKEKPFSTEHIVTAWNPAELDEMALPPCHFGFQVMCYPLGVSDQKLFKKDDSEKGWTVDNERAQIGFDLVWDQRSVDTFLGLPFNIASYAMFMRIIEAITGYKAMNLLGSLRNVHLYDNALELAREQIMTDTDKHGECQLVINRKIDETCLDSLNLKDFSLNNYSSYPALRTQMLGRDLK